MTSATASARPSSAVRIGAGRRAARIARSTLHWLRADFRRWLPAAVLLAFVVVAIGAPVIAPYGASEVVYGPDGGVDRLQPPSWAYPFGTTSYGNDVLSQIIWGAQRALFIGGSAALVALVIGVNVGLLAGFRGGWIDTVLMRITDMAFALPFLPLAIVLIGLFGRNDLTLLIVIGALFWRTTARVVRSQVLSLKQRPFIDAARVAGARPSRIMFRHIAPNVFSIAILYGILLIAEAVLAEAMLSFLGLAPAGSISWGTIMNAAFSSGQLRLAWWWALFPGLFITIFVLATSLVGQAYERTRRLRGEER